MDEKRKQLAFAITEYLSDAIENNHVTEENKDGLEGKKKIIIIYKTIIYLLSIFNVKKII